MCSNPNTEDIFANIFMALTSKSSLAFFRIFDANIEILDLGPYIAFQYNFSKEKGQEFKAKNKLAATFISLLEKSNIISSELLFPIILRIF